MIGLMLAAAVEIARVTNEESAWSPDGRVIAFDSDRGGRFANLYTFTLATGDTLRLTTTNANDITPAFSPDGKSIVFVSDRSGHNEIYVIAASGGAARRLTNDSSDDIHPSWSRDGAHIIYCSARDNPDPKKAAEGDRYEIYTVALAGGATRRLTNFGGINTYPSYSPDGAKILFRKVLGQRNSEVWVMNADGSGAGNLTNNPAFDAWPQWSPDGKRIVFGSNRSGSMQIYTMNADGSDVRQLTALDGYATSPKWSPDGKTISFDLAVNRIPSIFLIPAP